MTPFATVRALRRLAASGSVFLCLCACQSSSPDEAGADSPGTMADGGARVVGGPVDASVHDAGTLGVATGAGDGAAKSDAHDGNDGSTPEDAAAADVPAPALAVGFTTRTFASTKLGTTPGTWQNFGFFGAEQPPGNALQNPDGTLALPGLSGDTYGATLATATSSSNAHPWQGMAFGGGGYFAATLSFTGTPDGSDQGSPSFWANDVEHSSGALPTTSGQSWIEIDDLETNVASDGEWGQSLHNWYNAGEGNTSADPPPILAGNPVAIPRGGTFSGLHTYAFLWVPATATTQGSLQFFCDGTAVGGAAHWSQYSASQPFPPAGDDIGNVLDTLHLYLILGDDSTKYPATVTSVEVWQASAAANLSY